MPSCEDHTFAICAYKESPYLEECIVSLKNQSIKSHILLATSTPCAYLENMAARYQIPYFVNEGEAGITQDWNFAYAQAKTTYVTIAHQDDVYGMDYLASVLEYVGRAKKPLIFFSDYYEIRNGQTVSSNRLLWIKRFLLLPLRVRAFWGSVWIRRRVMSMGSVICCPSVTMVKPNLPAVVFRNGFRSCQDWEAWESISRWKGEFVYCPKMLMGHRIHADSETSATIQNHKRTEEEYQMYCKFWPRWFAGLLARPYVKGQDSNNLR